MDSQAPLLLELKLTHRLLHTPDPAHLSVDHLQVQLDTHQEGHKDHHSVHRVTASPADLKDSHQDHRDLPAVDTLKDLKVDKSRQVLVDRVVILKDPKDLNDHSLKVGQLAVLVDTLKDPKDLNVHSHKVDRLVVLVDTLKDLPDLQDQPGPLQDSPKEALQVLTILKVELEDLLVDSLKADSPDLTSETMAMMAHMTMEIIQLSPVNLDVIIRSIPKYFKLPSVAMPNNILDIMLTLRPNVKYSTSALITKHTISYAPMVQSSLKNFSYASGGINLIAILLLASSVSTLTCMTTQ